MSICRTAVIPPIQPEYQAISIQDDKPKQIARIVIHKGVDRPYYTSHNKYHLRVGTTKRIASREELIRLFQASGLFHYDIIEAAGSQLKSLNQSAIADYFSRYKIDYEQEDEEERLRLLWASDISSKQQIPTVGGLLVFGISPERYLPQSGIALGACPTTRKLVHYS